MANKIKIGITQGDVAGVGWEVILKTLADERMGELAEISVYGSKSAADVYRGLIPVLSDVSMNIVDTGAVEFEPGVPTKATGEAAVGALRAAVGDLKKGALDAIVTAPIAKEFAQGDDFRFVGHTEFLAAEFGGAGGGASALMMMVSEGLRVALVTSHMALADVPGAVSRDKIVDKLRVLRTALIKDFGVVEPRIAVLSLNPHGGEGGMLGSDEAEVIVPAVKEVYKEGILAFGPMAVDGLFVSGCYNKYDAILAMYHDQGLAPFKALAPDGVNFTAGLPVVRTSPDHGTAFDIAGKGVADEASMRSAVYCAIDVCRCRANYAEATKNPLKHYEREKGDERTIDFSKSEI